MPDRPVISFTGDGGFWYHMSELETAVRYGINAVIVVNNNRALSQNKRGDDRAYEGYSGDPTELYAFADVILARLAEAMGCFGIEVEQTRKIGSALEQALASGKPAVVEVVTDINGMPALPWSP